MPFNCDIFRDRLRDREAEERTGEDIFALSEPFDYPGAPSVDPLVIQPPYGSGVER